MPCDDPSSTRSPSSPEQVTIQRTNHWPKSRWRSRRSFGGLSVLLESEEFVTQSSKDSRTPRETRVRLFFVAFSPGPARTETKSAPSAEKYKEDRDALRRGLYFCQFPDRRIGSNGLRNYMNRNASRLSDGCVRALIAAGKVSRAEVEGRRVKYGR